MKEPSQKEPDRNRKSSGIPETPLPQIHWDDSQMASSYANVVNAHRSREEVTLFFSTQGWSPAEGKKVAVKLSNRLILNPRAAKRLLTLLGAVIAEYERRFGAINIGPTEERHPER
jgi:hypothetical protein